MGDIFMHTTISYKGDNTKRRAIIDLIGWYGLSKSKLIFRSVRAAKTIKDLDNCDMAICFSGVTGEPVRRLFAYCHGEHVLDFWMNAERGDPTVLASIPGYPGYPRLEMATA